MRSGQRAAGSGQQDVRSVLVILFVVLLTACGGGGMTATQTAPPSPTVAAPTQAAPTTTAVSPTATPLSATPAARTAQQPASETPTAAPTATTAPPTAAPATATAQPFKPTITKVTDGGCCRNPTWHPDGARILYTDAIPNQQLAGTHAVPADGSGPPTLFWPSAATVSPDGSRIAFPDVSAHVTRIQEFGKQSVATIDNNAAYVWFSTDGRQVAWLERAPGAQPSSNVDRLVRVWVANADGSNARRLGPTVRAADLTWFPDGRRLLFVGRDTDGGNPGIYVLDIAASTLTRVVDAFSPRGARLAPDGSRIVYLAALEENPEDNGLFIVNADGSAKRKLPLLGGVRWAPDSKSFVILPFQTDNGPDQLIRIDAATQATAPLTDRAALPFRVAQDEWQLAPDGTRIVFNALQDSNIYVLRFQP
jgi:Tol biopolymer transport system component